MPFSPDDNSEEIERRREARREAREREAAAASGTDTNPNAPLKYDLAEIERRRNWVGEQLWHASAAGQLNLKDRNQVAQFLGSLRPSWFGGEHGLRDEKEKGRHMRKLFLGDLGAEGWGMGEGGYSKGIEAYRPNWSTMVSGLKKGGDGLYGTDGGKWYDAFGRLVRTDPVAATTTAAPVATATATTPPIESTPTPNPTFYGGSTAPNAYGTSPTTAQSSTNPTQPKKPNTSSAPGWYSTWRF